MKYTVIWDSRQTIDVEAPGPNWAVRIARDAPLEQWQLTDIDDLSVVSGKNDDQEEFDWSAVEDLAGETVPEGARTWPDAAHDGATTLPERTPA